MISKPKKTKASINPLGVDIYIYRYMISLNLRIKTLPATAWGLGITYPQSIKRLGHFLTADNISAGTLNGGRAYPALWKYTRSIEPAFNCRLHSILLHELLLSEGIVNRFVTCHPADSEDSDCHVVNLVWLPELQKWAMLDSDMKAWAEDEKGTPLSLAEMRERYIDGREIVYRPLLNSDNDFVYYRAYWAKNLYWFDTWETTGYGREDNNPAYRNKNRHIVLVPSGFKSFELPDHSVLTTDTSRFWAAPQN